MNPKLADAILSFLASRDSGATSLEIATNVKAEEDTVLATIDEISKYKKWFRKTRGSGGAKAMIFLLPGSMSQIRLFVDQSGGFTNSSLKSALKEEKEEVLQDLEIELARTAIKQSKRANCIAIFSVLVAAAALVISIFKD